MQGSISGRWRRKKRNKHVHSCIGRSFRIGVFGMTSWRRLTSSPHSAGSF